MRRECRWERFPRHRFQRKPLVSDPGMHHGTCVTHVPWCMSGLLTRGGGENVPGIPGACATRNFTYLVRGPLSTQWIYHSISLSHRYVKSTGTIPQQSISHVYIFGDELWWRHGTETRCPHYRLLWVVNPVVTDAFPHKVPVMRQFAVRYCRWCNMLWRSFYVIVLPIWRHSNAV